MPNKNAFVFCNIYILLWLLYAMQSIFLGGTGGPVSTLILFVLIGISLYHFIYAFLNYKMPVYMKCLALLVLMFTVYGVILIISGETITFMRSGHRVNNYNYIKKIYASLLPIYSFYVFTRKGVLTKELLLKWSFVFFITAGMQFIQGQRRAVLETMDEDVEITNNYAYLFLSMIPLLVFWSKNKFVQYTGLIITLVFIILGMKRGAILTGALAVAMFMYRTIKTATRKQKIWVLVLSMILIVAGYFTVRYMLVSSGYFNYRIEKTLEGNSSGRNDLYGFYWNHFINETSTLRFLFGNGANATLKFSWNYAHNDWLEIATNQGLLGLVVFIIYWVGFYRTWKSSSFDDEVYLAMGLSLLILFVKTWFSMSYGAMSLYATICVGYCVGMVSEHWKRAL